MCDDDKEGLCTCVWVIVAEIQDVEIGELVQPGISRAETIRFFFSTVH